MFTDNYILFFKASYQVANKVEGILNAYATTLGQLINKNKSTLILSANDDEETRDMVSLVFNISAR